MNAPDFWTAVLMLTMVGALWLIVVLLVLDVRVTASLAWLDHMLGLAGVLFADQAQVCAWCGRPANLLGVSGPRRWFYCDVCKGDAWQETDAPAPPPRPAALEAL